LLPKYCFYRVHKSYAVNLYCIQKIVNNEIVLLNGEKVSISRNNLGKFKITYKKFIKDYYLNI
jgi:DNA-binding LytR/AlgR family response regulator